MQQPFGHTLKVSLALARPWLRLGPGWAALTGALSTGHTEFNLATLLQLVSLWLLVDPILGMLWDGSVEQGLWRKIAKAQLGSPSTSGFSLPYVQPDSAAGRLVLHVRRYQVWWREMYWPENGSRFTAFWLGAILALLIGLFLTQSIFWLTLLAIVLIILAGQISSELTAPYGGRLQSAVQLLLPWSMGLVLWSPFLPLLGLALAVCYWATYLGGLRMLGHHHRAGILFFLGQGAAIILLLGLRQLPGAAILSVLLIAQWIIKLKFNPPADFLQKVQPYLVVAVLVAGLSMGRL
ncbi:hypothetical protein ACFLXQ_08595 [Chloroflexota bacterium]